MPEPFVTETVAELAAHRAIIETSLRNITLEFLPELAPNHVRNFLRLAETGVYDGTAFHRVARGFVVQGGYMPSRREPLDVRQEQSIRTLDPEFSPTPHEKGTLSMAHGDDPASASTSFFLVTARAPGLDNLYTVFGRVAEGLDVLERMEAAPVNGEEPIERVDVVRMRVVGP